MTHKPVFTNKAFIVETTVARSVDTLIIKGYERLLAFILHGSANEADLSEIINHVVYLDCHPTIYSNLGTDFNYYLTQIEDVMFEILEVYTDRVLTKNLHEELLGGDPTLWTIDLFDDFSIIITTGV